MGIGTLQDGKLCRLGGQVMTQGLKSTVPFLWTQELQMVFEAANLKIVELVKEGVRSFQQNVVTLINPDWSKVG